MLSILLWCLVFVCLGLGLIGCFVNRFPGPLLVLIACLIASFGLNIEAVSILTLIVVAGIWIVTIILNKKILPMLAKKMHDFSGAGSWGCTIGCLLGLPLLTVPESSTGIVFMALISFVILPYAFALLFEFVKRKDASVALKAGASAYSVYLASTVFKFLAVIYAVWAIFNI